MLFEVKVSEPVAKSVNNKIVQFYPVEAVIVRCDDDDIGGGEYDKKKTSTTFTSVRRFSQFRELYAFSSTKGARLPPFPPKALIVSPQHLEERRAAFEQILNIMMNDRTLNVLPEVASFIGCKELFLDGALRILENAGDNWTIPKRNKNRKNGSSNNSNDNINGKSSGNNETTPQRHERRKSNGFDGYDSWEEETPIMSSLRSKQKCTLEEFHLSSAALHKTIAASPSPLKFTPASEDKNGSISSGLTSMMKSTATMTATTTSRENPVTLESQQQQQPQRAFNGVEAREAIKLGDAASLDTILSSGQVDPNYRDGHGFTLLMLAAMFNKKECCLKLLASGARKELVNRDDETAIDLAPVSLANIIRQYK